MALNKKSLGSSLLSKEKASNDELSNGKFSLDSFAVVHNKVDDTDMICFTVVERPDNYFWASTSLYTFLNDNIENAEYDDENISYSFPEDDVFIEYAGKTTLKNDASKSCNVWKISF